MSKYKAKPTVIDGIRFDSKAEAHRYEVLKALEDAGKITNLRRQVKYVLIPAQRNKDGKLLERETSYRADFVYEADGKEYVEDVKGVRTDVYKLKKKMMLYIHGIEISEVK